MDGSVYITGMGLITAIGDQPDLVFSATIAGVTGYETANYFARDHQNMVLATVPDEALPDLSEHLNFSGKLSFRDKRLLKMSLVAAGDAMRGYSGTESVPLIFSAPQHYSCFDNRIDSHFLTYLCEQSGMPLDPEKSRIVATGRSGVIDAIKLAQHFLYESNYDRVLVGGADSCQHNEFLEFLDVDSRVKTRSVNPTRAEDCFVPGEAAGFILLSRNPTDALHENQHRIRLDSPGFGHEPGHLYSEQEYLGDGLDQAVKQTLAGRADANIPIQMIYNSMNGEHHWAKEFGVFLTRNHTHFVEQPVVEHPSEYYGDIGAATGAALIQLAHSRLLKDKLDSCLVCSSSDDSARAAICLTSELVGPWQN